MYSAAYDDNWNAFETQTLSVRPNEPSNFTPKLESSIVLCIVWYVYAYRAEEGHTIQTNNVMIARIHIQNYTNAFTLVREPHFPPCWWLCIYACHVILLSTTLFKLKYKTKAHLPHRKKYTVFWRCIILQKEGKWREKDDVYKCCNVLTENRLTVQSLSSSMPYRKYKRTQGKAFIHPYWRRLDD